MMRENSTARGGVFGAVMLAATITACATADPRANAPELAGDAKDTTLATTRGVPAGAVAGGAIGVYMDAQELRLREQLEGTGVRVARVGDSIILSMPGNITFNTGSSELRPTFFEVLNSVAIVLEEYQSTTVEVAGHTDTMGSSDFNQTLSEERAMSVASYLRSHGVSPTRIRTIGYGEQHPVAENATTEGRKKNRRVELSLMPIVS